MARRNTRTAKNPEQEVTDWNARVKLGDLVEIPRSYPGGTPDLQDTHGSAGLERSHSRGLA